MDNCASSRPSGSPAPPATSARPFRLGEATPAYSLRLWHGFTLALLMSAAAMAGGALLYRSLRGYLSIGIEGSPVLRHFKAQRIFDRLIVSLSWRLAKSGAQLLSTRRLQPQPELLRRQYFVLHDASKDKTRTARQAWPLLKYGI